MRKGLGGRLVNWGTEEADKEGLECYLDASTSGKPLCKLSFPKEHSINF